MDNLKFYKRARTGGSKTKICKFNSPSILSRGNSNRCVYRNFWVYDGFWKLHIFPGRNWAKTESTTHHPWPTTHHISPTNFTTLNILRPTNFFFTHDATTHRPPPTTLFGGRAIWAPNSYQDIFKLKIFL